MFPEDFCALLASLQSSAPRHSFTYTKQTILKEFGAPIEDVFDHFPKHPVASGSVSSSIIMLYMLYVIHYTTQYSLISLLFYPYLRLVLPLISPYFRLRLLKYIVPYTKVKPSPSKCVIPM